MNEPTALSMNGILLVAMLFAAGIAYDKPMAVTMAFVSAGIAYLFQFLVDLDEMDVIRLPFAPGMILFGGSIVSAIVGFVSLFAV